MRLVFMGTPEFAIPTVRRLADSEHDVALVVTQTDKPTGRHRRLTAPPVKKTAQELGLPVSQPQTLKDEQFRDRLTALAPDAVIVAAYGKIIPKWLLDLPSYGCLNVHASLLPRYRGAAPIQRAVINGDRETGITIIRLDEGLDTGDMLLQQAIPIDDCDTAGTLATKMAALAPELVIKTLDGLSTGTLSPRKQPDDNVSLAPKIEKEETKINWAEPALKIRNLVRGLNPKPGAYTDYSGGRLKVWCVEVPAGRLEEDMQGTEAKAGTIIALDPRKGPIVATTTEPLLLAEVQPPNADRMGGGEFLRGHVLQQGERLT